MYREASAVLYGNNTAVLCTLHHTEAFGIYTSPHYSKPFAARIEEKKVKCGALHQELANLSSENQKAEENRRWVLSWLLRKKYLIEDTLPAFVQRMANIKIEVEWLGLYSRDSSLVKDINGDVVLFMGMLQVFRGLVDKPTSGNVMNISFPYV